MKTESHPSPKVRIKRLTPSDFEGIVRSNKQTLATSFVVINQDRNEVLVLDQNAADMKFRSSPTGMCVPTGTKTIDGSLYRTYLVNPKLLTQ